MAAPEGGRRRSASLASELAAHLEAQRAAGARMVVSYAGGMGLPNALDCCWTPPHSCAGPVRLRAGGIQGRRAERLAEPFEPDQRRRTTTIPRQIRPAGRCDLALHRLAAHAVYRFGIAPNKLIDYMMAGRAILLGRSERPGARRRLRLTVAPEGPEAVARVAGAMSADERATVGAAAIALAHHAYPRLAARFARALR